MRPEFGAVLIKKLTPYHPPHPAELRPTTTRVIAGQRFGGPEPRGFMIG